MTLEKIRIEDFISLLKQKTTLTEVLECLEEGKEDLRKDQGASNVIYLDLARRKHKAAT